MSKIKFLKEYIKNPSNVGSITPSSKSLKKQMIKHIDFSKDLVILELGAGNGVFTKDLISKKTEKSILIIVENNPSFVEELNNKFSNLEGVFIFCEDVLNLDEILLKIEIKKVDYVVSSLPFLSLGEEFTEKVFELVKKYLVKEFILFQYTTILSKKLKKHFKKVNKQIVLKNIPPAFVFNVV